MNESPQDAHPQTKSVPKTCPCGHDRTHYAVSAEGQYSAWGWFCNLFGITATPKKVFYRCRHCQKVFDESEEPADLKIQA